jgi:hypothetical protein
MAPGRLARAFARAEIAPTTRLVLPLNPFRRLARKDAGHEHGVAAMTGLGAKLLTGSVLAVIGLITVKVLAALFAAVMGFLSFLLFTVLPIVLIGWLVIKVFKHLSKDKKPAYE